LQNFVPDDQHTKLAIIRRAARHLKPALSPRHAAPPPADDADIEALSRAAQGFLRAADLLSGKDADDARHLARLTAKLASAPPEIREKARRSLVPSLETTLGLLRASLDADSHFHSIEFGAQLWGRPAVRSSHVSIAPREARPVFNQLSICGRARPCPAPPRALRLWAGESGAPRPDLGPGVRIAVVTPYVVIYRHITAEDSVTVLRIVHGHRKIAAKLLTR
jgi:hypothetical protein